jgi:hypothetical protein
MVMRNVMRVEHSSPLFSEKGTTRVNINFAGESKEYQETLLLTANELLELSK